MFNLHVHISLVPFFLAPRLLTPTHLIQLFPSSHSHSLSNALAQNHPLTAAFFSQSVAIDVSVGVLMPPPVKNNPRSIMPPQPPSQQQLSPHNPNSPLVEARVLMSPSKRLVTMVVDIELSKAFANPRGCAAAAASTLVEKLRVATHNDLSELRVISIGKGGFFLFIRMKLHCTIMNFFHCTFFFFYFIAHSLSFFYHHPTKRGNCSPNHCPGLPPSPGAVAGAEQGLSYSERRAKLTAAASFARE